MSLLTPLRSERLSAPGIAHGFFTRQGGVSYGVGDLNCGPKSGDNPEHIAENRRRLGQTLGGSLEGVSQVHSADVVTLTSSQDGERPNADALVTNMPGLALSVLTADCGPILFADAKAGVIGAAHSGWKGTVGRIAQNTVRAMERLGADPANITAVLGPTIAQPSYEVGAEFPDLIAAACKDPLAYLTASTNQGKWMFDLPGLIEEQLKELVGQALVLNRDTYVEEDLFFSYRRATHRGETEYGRQISGICLAS